MNGTNAQHNVLTQTSFFETIVDYVSKSPQSDTKLIQFAYAIDRLPTHHWLEVGYAVSDIRFALAFPLIYLVAEQVIGSEWEQLCKNLIADGQRYAAAVSDKPQIRNAFRGGKYIWNVGHGVAGAVAELLIGNSLQKRGMPPMFFPLFDQAGINDQTLIMATNYH